MYLPSRSRGPFRIEMRMAVFRHLCILAYWHIGYIEVYGHWAIRIIRDSRGLFSPFGLSPSILARSHGRGTAHTPEVSARKPSLSHFIQGAHQDRKYIMVGIGGKGKAKPLLGQVFLWERRRPGAGIHSPQSLPHSTIAQGGLRGNDKAGGREPLPPTPLCPLHCKGATSCFFGKHFQ